MVASLSLGQAKSYFNDNLSRSDYYLNDQEVAGAFHGKIAEKLGLFGEITRDTFHALCDNLHPITGDPLTLRTNDYRRVGYDISFHVPKSVSVLHILSKDDDILRAFQKSVHDTMQEIEADAKTRVRKHGKDDDRETGELLYADFIHQTARPVDGHLPDPHLHCHCFTFNVTYDPVEQCYKAAQFGDIKRDMPYYQARFHKNLSDRLIALGYAIRRTATAFEIEGVPGSVIDLFSKRTNEIGQIAKEKNITDAKDLDALGAKTRSKKQKGLTLAQLKKDWRKQIAKAGMDTHNTPVRFSSTQTAETITTTQCLDHALLARFERASVMPVRRVLETAYRRAIGCASVSVDAITHRFKQDDRIIHLSDQLCTTKGVLAEEKRMLAIAQKGKGAFAPLYDKAPALKATGQHAHAIGHILTTPDGVTILSGRAGTGKTTLMQEAVPLIEAAIDKPAVIVAPTAEAARGVLRQEGFMEAETVAKLLADPVLQERLANGVLWVDEAGLLGVQDMTALLALADNHRARVVQAGDTRQHGSVVRGDALRVLEKIGGVHRVEISRIYRQRNEDYREAVQALADGDVSAGFGRLEALGAIREIDPTAPYSGLVDDYMLAVKKKKSVLVVSPTHKQGEAVTAAIRERLKQEKRIGKRDRAVMRFVSRSMTEADKQDGRNFREGDALVFSRSSGAFQRKSVWYVCGCSGNDVIVQDGNGDKAVLSLDSVTGFEVYNRSEIPLAKGDNIRITRNGEDARFKRLNNGQTMTVKGFDRKGNILAVNRQSKAEYVLPADYGHIAHAYCVTSHASQGKTVDEVFIMQPSDTFAATNRKQFYVSVSRGRDAVHIYTDDKEELLRNAMNSGDRVSAVELVQDHTALFQTNKSSMAYRFG